MAEVGIMDDLTEEQESQLRGDNVTSTAPDETEEPKEPEEPKEQEVQGDEQEEDIDPTGENLAKALKAERAKRKQAQEEYAQRMAEIEARTEQRIAQLAQQFRPQDPQPEPPDLETNPIEAIKYQQEQTENRFRELQAQQAQSRFEQAITSADADGRTRYPDYDAAIDHIKQVKVREISATGIPPPMAQQIAGQFSAQYGRNPNNEELINAAADRMLIGMAQSALMNNQNVADAAMALAKNYGYQGQAAPAEGPAEAPTGADQELARLRETKKAAGLKTGAAPKTPGMPTTSEVLKMDEDEWEKYLGSDIAWRKFNGG